MVKLNLLEIPEGQTPPPENLVKPTANVKSSVMDDTLELLDKKEPTPTDDFEFDMDTPLFPIDENAVEETQEEPVENTAALEEDLFKTTPEEPSPTAPPLFEAAEEPQTKTTEAPPTTSEHTEKQNNFAPMLKWAGIGVGILVLLIALYFAFTKFFSSDDATNIAQPQQTVPQTQNNPQAPAETAETPAQANTIPQLIAGQYRLNAVENNFRLNTANKLSGIKSGGYLPKLVVVADGYAYLSVLAASRNEANQLAGKIKAALNGGTVKLENTETVVIDGHNKVLANFSVRLPSPAAGSVTTNFDKVVDEANLNNVLKALATRHKVRMNYFKRGAKKQQQQLTATNYYLSINGAQQNIADFVAALAKEVPAISIQKLSIFSQNRFSINPNRTLANLDIVFYSLN
jgi:hypothetical protein